MIERYASSEMSALFADEARMNLWMEIELLALEGWAAIGVVPRADAELVRKRAPVIDRDFVNAVSERERVTNHDVAAFVDVLQTRVGPPEGEWIHYGLTSSDVVDTAQCLTLARAADLLLSSSSNLVSVLRDRALEFAATPMPGRTHGMHAEPTTFGAKLALWCLQADRDRQRLRTARESIAVGKLSGAVGTYSNVDPKVEEHVCASLGLRPVPATQVIARDRHAELLWACASAASSVESFATEVRHLQRTEVAEAEEPFGKGQKGSSAMPHKRNPVLSERMCGLARVVRGYLGAGLENVALWHERDISHSSAERIILPDALQLTHYLLKTMARIVEGLVVNAARMHENLESSGGLMFSQPVLLAMIKSGMDRDVAYRTVQRDARMAYEGERTFQELLADDPEVPLTPEVLSEAFSLQRSLRNVNRVIDAAREVVI
ncbi:MAG: adenylosuccinate lyase [Acidimicrobiales bacterium]